MNRQQLLNDLQLHDYKTLDQQVNLVTAFDLKAIVDDRHPDMALDAQARVLEVRASSTSRKHFLKDPGPKPYAPLWLHRRWTR